MDFAGALCNPNPATFRTAVATPANLIGISPGRLILWIRPILNHKKQDAAGTIPVSVELDPVGKWINQGVGPFSPDQSTDDRRPKERLAFVNGFPATQFGISALVHLRSVDLATYMDGEDAEFTLAIVFQKLSNTDVDILVGAGEGFGPSAWFFGTGAGYRVDKVDSVGLSKTFSSAIPPDLNTHLAVIRMNPGGTMDFWLDGVRLATAHDLNVGPLALSFVGIGAWLNASITNPSDAVIPELAFWDIPLTDAQIENTDGVNDLLMTAYGL